MATTEKLDGSGTPIDKNNKYDRQLRLWGDHGQTALETARVCLINATATGTEILKNLILPGIGSFTVVDGNKVQGEDVGNNFFLTKDSIGTSRAKVATELLGELNNDVTGDFVEEHTENLLETNEDFFKQFSIVIATNLCERTLLKLAQNLWDRTIPLLVCRCYGFIGYLRLVVKEHTVVESHPDSAHEDLRLDRPFDGLVTYANSLNLETMNKKDHSHTPWLIVLYKYLEQWKKEHNGMAPKNYREKSQLKELIKSGVRRNEEGILEEEENFDEAVKSVNTALVETRIPNNVNEVFKDKECCNIHSESKSFWILARAVKDFVKGEGNGALPVRGSIPDMTADSDRYIQLQQVYRQQAEKDALIVAQKVQDLLQSVGRGEPLRLTRPITPSQCSTSHGTVGVISESEIKTFCRNAAFLRVIRCRSLADEYSSELEKLEDLAVHLDDEEPDDVVFYVLLRAVDRFYEEYTSYPGWFSHQVEADVAKLKVCLNKLIHDWGLTCTVKDDYVHEMCRYGASEIHTLAAYIGGVAAQEVIKVVTRQFVPFNNTYIYNAMKQTSVTVEL